eukprot:TRINITY_DN4391_c0_g1_i2.p1 TRINITY_DN4391_c0_g1~~TRINITY_DN4391_c0_g1_i2.p1  ORF type:complete len:276 (-),score=18.27 TRINITY_DN4391_c0_g1_i2:268-1095(-)
MTTTAACDRKCLKCFGPLATNCLDCNSGRHLSEGSCLCPSGHFDHPLTMECRECHSTCLECEGGDSDECKSCDAVLNRFLLNGRCLCREGFYETSETNGVCARCHSSCDTCFGPKENQCILCPNNRRGPVDGSCICNPGLFIGPDGDCKRCHGSCKTCKGPSANDCLSCSNEKELNGTSCICKSGYFNNGGECIGNFQLFFAQIIKNVIQTVRVAQVLDQTLVYLADLGELLLISPALVPENMSMMETIGVYRFQNGTRKRLKVLLSQLEYPPLL